MVVLLIFLLIILLLITISLLVVIIILLVVLILLLLLIARGPGMYCPLVLASAQRRQATAMAPLIYQGREKELSTAALLVQPMQTMGKMSMQSKGSIAKRLSPNLPPQGPWEEDSA